MASKPSSASRLNCLQSIMNSSTRPIFSCMTSFHMIPCTKSSLVSIILENNSQPFINFSMQPNTYKTYILSCFKTNFMKKQEKEKESNRERGDIVRYLAYFVLCLLCK